MLTSHTERLFSLLSIYMDGFNNTKGNENLQILQQNYLIK